MIEFRYEACRADLDVFVGGTGLVATVDRRGVIVSVYGRGRARHFTADRRGVATWKEARS